MLRGVPHASPHGTKGNMEVPLASVTAILFGLLEGGAARHVMYGGRDPSDEAAAVVRTLVLGVMFGLCLQHAMWWGQATGRALLGLGRWVLRARHSPITPNNK